MSFGDLCLRVGHLSRSQSEEVVRAAKHLGYSYVALDIQISGRITTDMVCSISTCDMPAQNVSGSFCVGGRLGFQQLTRATVKLSENSQVHALGSAGSAIVRSFDILAVEPTNEKCFQQACTSMDVDIISFDLSRRFPFKIGFPMARKAAERGIFFELCLDAIIGDSAWARQSAFSNAMQLLRVTKGRNLIISSGSYSVCNLRRPLDMVHVMTMLGQKHVQALAAVRDNAWAVCRHAIARRATMRAVMRVEPLSSIRRLECWTVNEAGAEVSGKRKRAATEDQSQDKASTP